MVKFINLGNEKYTLEVLEQIKSKDKLKYDIRITNSHITELNKVLGTKIFKNDAVYISYQTLWEIMQPIGGRGRHHYHGLSPKNIYDALSTMHLSKNISVSYDNRYVILTLAKVMDDIDLAVIVRPDSGLDSDYNASIIKIITIYPYTNKKWEPNGALVHHLGFSTVSFSSIPGVKTNVILFWERLAGGS